MRLPRLVQTPEGLDEAIARLRPEPALALDTETDSYFAYHPRICLIQISVPGYDCLIDPLAQLDLDPLGALLADPGKEVVLHASENDAILMHHEFGWRIANLYDTQVACFVLGLAPYSLAGVVETRFGRKLDKRQQRSDWSRRPLKPQQIAYAAEDTRYLLDLARDLKTRAQSAGREEEIAWECKRIANREWSPEPFDPENFRKLRAARKLEGTDLRVLRELFLFRHRVADRRNRAPYRILSDAGLAALATWHGGPLPKAVPSSFWQRHGRSVERHIARARKAGPLPPRRRRVAADCAPLPRGVKQRYERLRRWRREACAARGVESFVVARNGLLMRIARADPQSAEELRELLQPFRMREYGKAILAALLDLET